MIDYDIFADKILERMSQRLDAFDNYHLVLKTRYDKFVEMKLQLTQLQANYGYQKSKIEHL